MSPNFARYYHNKRIKFSSWEYNEVTGSEGNSKKMLTLTTKKIEIKEFFKNFFIPTVEKLPMHVKIMILQWAVFKQNPRLPMQSDSDHFMIIRTREDFQEDLKVLLREQTVSSHHGQGKISMTLYPVAVEIVCGNKLTLHAFTFIGHKLKKNFSTVHHFEMKLIHFFQEKYQKKCLQYIRMSDGSLSQFWSYGTYSSALLLRDQYNLKSVMFSRYAASEDLYHS